MSRRALPLLHAFVIIALAAYAAVAPVRAQASAERTSFPGAAIGRTLRGESPEELMRLLYAARDRRNPTYTNSQFCGRTPCKLRLLAADVWQGEDGAERILIVAAAEPPNPSHASPALLGMAVLKRAGNAWQLEAGAPNVDEIGEWGSAPPVTTILAGGFGRGAVAEPQFTAQGVQLETWGLYVPIDDRVVKVLQLESSQDSAASCESRDDICRRRADAQDFTSTVTTAPAADGGLDVSQAITLTARRNQPPLVRRWHIAPTGKVSILSGASGRRDR